MGSRLPKAPPKPGDPNAGFSERHFEETKARDKGEPLPPEYGDTTPDPKPDQEWQAPIATETANPTDAPEQEVEELEEAFDQTETAKEWVSYWKKQGYRGINDLKLN